MSQSSCLIQGMEIRETAKIGSLSFFSLKSAQKVLGNPEDINLYPRVRDYAWRSMGIHLQRGWRGLEKNKLFKLQIFFNDASEKVIDKTFGAFPGLVFVEGIEISEGTLLQSIRPQLERAGFKVTDETAEKGQITIFFTRSEHRVNRIEQWCP